MRQVNDFAISAPSQRIANHVLDLIDDKLTIPMKRQGLVILYNGLNIIQTRDYIKVLCETYIDRISNIHLLDEIISHIGPPYSPPYNPTVYESVADR